MLLHSNRRLHRGYRTRRGSSGRRKVLIFFLLVVLLLAVWWAYSGQKDSAGQEVKDKRSLHPAPHSLGNHNIPGACFLSASALLGTLQFSRHRAHLPPGNHRAGIRQLFRCLARSPSSGGGERNHRTYGLRGFGQCDVRPLHQFGKQISL